MRTVITKKALGISWDDLQVEACVIRTGIAEFAIEKIIRIDRDLNDAGNPKNTLSEDINKLTRYMGKDFDTCVTGLPEAEIMYRTLTRPFSDRKKVADTIGPEVETLLPALDSRLLVDFVMMGKDETGSNRIQALCTRFSTVQGILGSFKDTSLDPEIIHCPSVSIAAGARALLNLPDEKTVVLMNMGWKETSVAILADKMPAYVGSLPFGFERIASSAASEQGHTKRMILDNAKVLKLPAGDKLAAFFREILIILEKNGIAHEESVLVATGYARLIADLDERSQEALGIPVLAPSLKDVHYEGSQQDLLYSFLSASFACRAFDSGDAVNFRQGELGVSKRMKMLKGQAGSWIKAALVLFLIWVAGLTLDVSLKTHINKDLTSKIDSEFASVMPKNTPKVEPVKQMEQYLGKLSGQAGDLQGGGGTPLEILRDLSAGIPSGLDVIFDSINIDEGDITLTGSTSSYDNVERIKVILSGFPYVKEVKIVSAVVDKNDQKVKLKLLCKK
jgi:hypothetical protein